MIKRSPKIFFNKLWINAFLWIMMVIIIYPLFWMFQNSLKTSTELFMNSFTLPENLLFSNYVDAWELGFANFFFNSVLVTGVSVLVTIIFSAFCAYALVDWKSNTEKSFYT